MKFTYNPRIIRHLGYELITSDAIALTELIKNSYDAKAKKVNVIFINNFESLNIDDLDYSISQELSKKIATISNKNGLLIIEDNGDGMDYEKLQNAFFEIGTSTKRIEKNNQVESDTNVILGDKGIGRLASQRLAPILIVESCAKNSKNEFETNAVIVEWSNFLDINNTEYDAPELKLDNPLEKSYTRLWLIGNENQSLDFDKLFENKILADKDVFGNEINLTEVMNLKDEFNSALSFLFSPFEKNNSVIELKIKLNSQPVSLNFYQETLKVAESKHEFDTKIIYDDENKPIDLLFELKMEIKPWFIERIHLREVGQIIFNSIRLGHKDYNKLLQKYSDQYKNNLSESFKLSEVLDTWSKKYDSNFPKNFTDSVLSVAPLKGHIYSFKRDQQLLSIARQSALENGYIDHSTRVNYNIRPFLDSNNGIKLYRNSFRIASIGNRDNDWLELQQRRTSGQQFFRYELGNVVGYIQINDKKQKFIYETSSREHLTSNRYVESLQIVLGEVVERFSPHFNKRAVQLTKHILDIEGLIPENNEKELQKRVDDSKKILENTKRNLSLVRNALTSIKDDIDLDTDEKVKKVKNILIGLTETTLDFEKNIGDTQNSLESANLYLENIRQEQSRVKTEAYNNYKLMANGLVTEVITHELHSMLSNTEDEEKKYDDHLKTIQKYFLDNELYDLNTTHFKPVKSKFEHLYNRMGDLSKFYSFLEKTFITGDGNRILEPTEVKSELELISERFSFRTKRHNINIEFDNTSNVWEVPKGALLHVFYNLIDNSIYWIKQRQSLAKTIPTYKRDEKDEIIIRTTSKNTIEFFDSGTGVLDKYQDILFNELVSGKDNGRGMGLYIVRQFLKSFGGNISLLDAKNQYGNRYIFEISLNDYTEENEQI